MRILAGFSAIIVLGWLVITTDLPQAPLAQSCTPKWFSYISNHYFDVSDREGHGPDPGSSEWLGSVERKIGLPVKEQTSDSQRCQLIQNHLEHHTYIINQQLDWLISF
jgi:hypothetical protein